MKMFLKFASIPLALFVVFFGLPRLVASLVNSHTDSGLLAVLVLVCGLFGWIANKIYVEFVKEKNDEQA